MAFLSAAGIGMQFGSVIGAFTLAASGVGLLPIAATCGAGFFAGSALKLDTANDR